MTGPADLLNEAAELDRRAVNGVAGAMNAR
jgi:hypothetical protein